MNGYGDGCLKYFNRDRIVKAEEKVEKEVADINLLKIILEKRMSKLEERMDKLEKGD